MSNNEFILSDSELQTMQMLEEMAKRKEAINEGIEQTNKDIALKMYKMNYDLKDISNITSLSIERIKNIINTAL